MNDLHARIDSKDRLADPRCFMSTRTSAPFGNAAKFLASLNAVKSHRPGTVGDAKTVGDAEIDYSLNFDRWVLCGYTGDPHAGHDDGGGERVRSPRGSEPSSRR